MSSSGEENISKKNNENKNLKKEFLEANERYQKCLNNLYDKFVDGHDVNFENACSNILEEIKQKGDYFNKFQNEFEVYTKKEGKNQN